MLQRNLTKHHLVHGKDLSNILLQLNRLTQKTKTFLVYAYLPLGLFPMGSQLPQPPSFLAGSNPVAQALPVTGGKPEAKEVAIIVAEKFPGKIQRPFAGGMLTTFYSAWHPGIDLAISIGTPIKPLMKGAVVESGWDSGGYGNKVVIDHGNGYKTLYAHMTKIYVKIGDTVEPETIIGTVGSTGRSTGSHLHLELHTDTGTTNPLDILPKDEPTTVADIGIAK